MTADLHTPWGRQLAAHHRTLAELHETLAIYRDRRLDLGTDVLADVAVLRAELGRAEALRPVRTGRAGA